MQSQPIQTCLKISLYMIRGGFKTEVDEELVIYHDSSGST